MLSNVVIMPFNACFIRSYFCFKDYTIDIFFRQWWRDPRLAHGEDKVFNAALDPRKLGPGIWTPDTYFRNVKSSNYHAISRENMRLRISKEGDIYFSAR